MADSQCMRLAPRFSMPASLGLALICLATLLAAPAASAETSELSSRLARVADPSFRAAPAAVQAERLSLAASGPGSLLRDGGDLVVEVRFGVVDDEAVQALRDAGAELLAVTPRYATVTVAAAPAELTALAAIAGVEAVTEVLTPLPAADCGGAFRSEGDAHMRVATARATFGLDGSGVTVGILSDSFDRRASAPTHASGDVASGDLPGPGSPCGSQLPVGNLTDPLGSGTDEGRAMAQIVHDLAPGAAIKFATAYGGEAVFAANIRALAAAGAKVITDDVFYFEEPFFQDGPIAVAVNEVVAGGVTYFSSAGNGNLISEGHEVASYAAPFRDAGSCPVGVSGGLTHCTDFDPGGGVDTAFDLTVPAGEEVRVDLQWAEPRGGVGTDLKSFLINGAGVLLASSSNGNFASQKPYDYFAWKNETGSTANVKLAIGRVAGVSSPLIKFIQLGEAVPTASQFAISSAGDTLGPAVFGHSVATGAISTAAVRYNATTAPETFSSRGPAVHYFGPVTGPGAAPALTVPAVRSKPDLAATDGGANTFFGTLSKGVWRFFGTSAAAPHAAAIAALGLQANPGLTPSQIRGALTTTARPVGSFGATAVGAGLVDATAALGALGSIPVAKPAALAPAPVPAQTAVRLPATKVLKRPPRVVRTSARRVRLVFRFGSDVAVTGFSCLVDGAKRSCGARFARRFGVGSHVVRVRARDAAGSLDPTAAVIRFRVVRIG